MRKYKVFIGGGRLPGEQFYYSRSRNSKFHIRVMGENYCEIYDMQNRMVSSARLLPDGRVVNVPIRQCP